MGYKDLAQKRQYQNAWHRRNRDRSNALKRRYRASLRDLVAAARRAGCVSCGETDPACLDFHHRDPQTKEFSLGDSKLRSNYGKARLLAELAKCIVLCANCHRKLHAGRKISLGCGATDSTTVF